MIVADAFLAIIGLTALIFASVNDIKTREVPDWLNYGLIVSAFAVRVFHSLIFSDFWYLLYGLIGFGVMFVIGIGMYYTKQWGGGDAKLVMGLGIVFASSHLNMNNLLISLLINIIILGALYGVTWSVYLAIKNKKVFVKSFLKIFYQKKHARNVSLVFGLLVIISLFFIPIPYMRFIFCMTALAIIVYSYLVIFVKAVEDSCMYKWLPVSNLTEGDWVAKPVYVNKRLICGPKDIGLEKHQITALKKAKVKKVFVKEGIPFVPSFLIASVGTLIWGNVLFLFI